MAMKKGSDYAGGKWPSFGGFRSESTQPKSAWTGQGKMDSNMPSSNLTSKGSMLGKKWKSTCSGCGTKM